MSTSAILMMMLALVVVWGGLVASVLWLRARPHVTDGPDESPELLLDDDERYGQPHPMRDT